MILCTGTSKGTEPYKVGKRTTDILLEILNLNKTEVISIDIISNQEFTEVINEHFMHVISPFSLFVCLHAKIVMNLPSAFLDSESHINGNN